MSSTNRGYERHKTDFYVTPQPAIKIFLDHFRFDVNSEFHDSTLILNNAKWFDPCAGGDAKHEMSYPEVIRKEFNPIVLHTMDIREDSKAKYKEDYLLSKDIKGKYDIIITNPPFFIAKEVILKALDDVCEGGYVIMLLRLNFFGSNSRFIFFQQQLPIWSYVHHRRFSFTEDSKTDSIEYMHAVWQKDVSPEFTMLKVI